MAPAGNREFRDLCHQHPNAIQAIALDRSTVHLKTNALANDSQGDGKENKRPTKEFCVSEKEAKAEGTQTQEAQQLQDYKSYDDNDYEPFPDYVEPPVPEHLEGVQQPLGQMQCLPSTQYGGERLEVLHGLSASPPEVCNQSSSLPCDGSPFANVFS